MNTIKTDSYDLIEQFRNEPLAALVLHYANAMEKGHSAVAEQYYIASLPPAYHDFLNSYLQTLKASPASERQRIFSMQ